MHLAAQGGNVRTQEFFAYIGVVDMNLNKVADTALSQLDEIGYRLEEYGITDSFNRHNCIAYLMNEQRRFQGELDSLQARIGTRKVQIEKAINRTEKLVQDGIDLALTPARFTLNTVKGLIKH